MKLFCCSLILSLGTGAAMAAGSIQVFFSPHGDCTKAAESSNAENLLVIQAAALAKKYAANWNQYRQHFDPHPGK